MPHVERFQCKLKNAQWRMEKLRMREAFSLPSRKVHCVEISSLDRMSSFGPWGALEAPRFVMERTRPAWTVCFFCQWFFGACAQLVRLCSTRTAPAAWWSWSPQWWRHACPRLLPRSPGPGHDRHQQLLSHLQLSIQRNIHIRKPGCRKLRGGTVLDRRALELMLSRRLAGSRRHIRSTA